MIIFKICRVIDNKVILWINHWVVYKLQYFNNYLSPNTYINSSILNLVCLLVSFCVLNRHI